jgi:hypothetical protein
VAAITGAHWPCQAGPAINVEIDPAGATAQELSAYTTAIEEASRDIGRPVVITRTAIPVSLVQEPDTIFVAWHPITKVPPPTAANPAWTSLYVDYPPLLDGSPTPEIMSADTVFSHGLPAFAAFHEVGREFGLGDSPFPSDDGYGGSFQRAGVRADQAFSPGDIAGLRAGAPPC